MSSDYSKMSFFIVNDDDDDDDDKLNLSIKLKPQSMSHSISAVFFSVSTHNYFTARTV
jgi:hypothetical protein